MLIFHFVMSVLLHIQIIHVIRPVVALKREEENMNIYSLSEYRVMYFFQFAAEVMREEGRGQ